jgi:hypothetical protein
MIDITVLGGVAEPVARFVGQKLGVAVEPVMYPNPEAYLQSFGKGEWDIAVGPRVLAPADKADSTANLWAISLVYVAAPGTEFADIASVDKAGVKIGTILGAPSDRVLTREIKAAEIVRIPLSPTIAADAADLLRSGKANVFGADPGVGYPAAEALPGAKIVPGAFGTVLVAAACRKAALPLRRLCSLHSSARQNRRVCAEGDRRKAHQGRERHKIAVHDVDHSPSTFPDEHRIKVTLLLGAAPPTPFRMAAKTLGPSEPSRLPSLFPRRTPPLDPRV